MRLGMLLVISLCGLLAGCQTFSATGQKPVTVGQPVATDPQPASGGISGGGLVGGQFGALLDPADRQVALNAEYKSLEYGKGGEIIEWSGTRQPVSGKVRAAQPYRVGSQDCRQYSHEITLSGQTTSAKATACRNGDGTWTMLE